MNRKYLIIGLLLVLVLALSASIAAAAPSSWRGTIGVNVVLNQPPSKGILAELNKVGKVVDVFPEINALTMRAKAKELPTIQSLPYVAAANPDAERKGAPIDTVEVENFLKGLSTWNLDAINVTDNESDERTVDQDGTGVYVAVLDTGLVGNWRQYFPEERIAEEYGISFGGGGNEQGKVSTQPNKWELSTDSHGTHVVSTILGYSLYGDAINGVAPMATVIPVKVLGNSGFGWSSMVAAGITYVADLKAGPLADYPVVINMSLGGPELDPLEEAAIDFAISQGVIIVASAGNEGDLGMGYPGAYPPVISVASSGWVDEWQGPPVPNFGWWNNLDVPEPTDSADFYISDFSSRQQAAQDLDLAAPGSWVVGPYQLQMGKISYFFLGGTSMASPHVAGTVALMAEKYPALSAADAETILEGSAVSLPAGSLDVMAGPFGPLVTENWGDNATGAGLLDAAAALAATP